MKLLTEFARERGEQPNTVAAYIRRHPEFEGHTQMDGKKMVLDDVAEEILEAVYPLPKPVEVIEDVETIKALSEERKKVILLQERLIEISEKVAQADAMQLLLEDRDKQLQQKQKEVKTLEGFLRDANSNIECLQEEKRTAVNEIEDKLYLAEQRIEQLQIQLDEKAAELSAERNKSFWQRLLGKKVSL